jgi:hypothetical protein
VAKSPSVIRTRIASGDLAIPLDRRRSWLGRQLGTLALAHVQTGNAGAALRAAVWHNAALKLGLSLPLFAVHDVGLLLTTPPGAFSIGPRPLLDQLPLPPESRGLLAGYRALLETIAESEVVQKAASWRLRDEMIAVLLGRVLGEPTQRFADRARAIGVAPLPLDPTIYQEDDAEVARHFADFDATPLLAFVRQLVDSRLEIYTAVERVDLDTLRLLGLLGDGAATALDLVDLYGAFGSAEANDAVNFSLELLPSVLETKRASGVQTFAVDGYASIERKGSPDSILLTEFAWDDPVFERKVIDQELYYYGRERQREEQRRLQYLLVDSSPSMRGTRAVFARGLALALGKKLALQGDEVWLRFFDSRLHDVRHLSGGDFAVPYVLGFRSERGRNYGRVFRQFLVELTRLRQSESRRIVVYVITHGQCHLPPDVVEKLAQQAFLYGVFILPSSEVRLDYLPLLHRHQVVDAAALGSREGRKSRALDIIADTAADAAPAARPRPAADGAAPTTGGARGEPGKGLA